MSQAEEAAEAKAEKGASAEKDDTMLDVSCSVISVLNEKMC
jgi:hypothetical protein